MNIWYLLTAIFTNLKAKPGSIDKHVKRLLLAGLLGALIYLAAFVYLFIWLFS